MRAAAARVGEALGTGPIVPWIAVVAGLALVVAASAVATRLNALPLALAAVVAAPLVLASLRWPLLPLALFAFLVPIETVLVIPGFGTLSRLAGLLFLATYALPRLGRLSVGALSPAGWAYLAWALASLAWAIEPGVAWTPLVTLVQLFAVALLIADFVAERPEIVRPILWVYSVSAAMTAAIGLRVYVAQGLADVRAAAIEDQNPAQFAAVLLPALVFGIYEVVENRRRLAGAALAAVTMAGILVSGTRGAWLAAVVVALLVLLPQLSMRRRVFAVGVLAALAVVALAIPGVADLLAERSQTALSSGGAGRTDIWAVGAHVFGSSPAMGVGYANFPVANTIDAMRASASGGFIQYAGFGPHNIVIGTLAELGLVGMGLFLAFLLPLALRRGWGPDAASIQASFISLLVLALFLDIVGNRKQVWLVIGIAAGLALLRRRRAGGAADPRWAPGTAERAAAPPRAPHDRILPPGASAGA